MKHQYSLKNRALAILLCVVMVVGMLPANVVAAGSPSTLTTTLGNQDYVVGQTQEFSVTSMADADAGKWVKAKFEIYDADGQKISMASVGTLEYWETDPRYTQNWYVMQGEEFGPVDTGFPLTDGAKSNFRVTFSVPGTYKVRISVFEVATSTELCYTEKTIMAFKADAGMITTNIGSQKFYNGLAQEFTFGSIANGDAGTIILGHFEFSDPSAIAKLEYYETNPAYGEGWHEMKGNDFGPVDTGFPMTDANSRFRVTFNKSGTYTVTVSAIRFIDRSVVARTTQTVVVAPLATVQSFTGGSVTGNTSPDVTLKIDSVTLNWDPADTSIGRNEDAWWVGMKVVAPVGMTEEQLKNAQYQSKNSPTGTWSENKSFWSLKDSKEGDAEHYIGMWFAITPAALTKFIEENRDIAMWYQFDWDNDGVFEQTITFSVDPNGVTLNKKDQTGFAFQTTNPTDMWIGEDTFKNEAVGGQGDGAVTYEIIAGNEYATIAADGTVTFGDIGNNEKVTITVKATKATDSKGFYHATTAQYNVTIYKKAQNPQFTSSNPSAMTYAPGASLENPLRELTTLKGDITYQVTEGEGVAKVDENGKLTILKAGTVTVAAIVAGDGKHKEAKVSYTLIINKAKQTPAFVETEPMLVYAPQSTFSNRITGAYGNVTIDGKYDGVTYKIINEDINGTDVAEINPSTGVLTIKKAGKVTVQVNIPADDRYHAPETAPTYTLTIDRAKQTGLAFANGTPEITWNDNNNLFFQALTGGQSFPGQDKVVYELTEHKDLEGNALENGEIVAKLDATTNGQLKILRSGKVTVKAYRMGDDCYKDSDFFTYTLTVQKADQTLTFTKGAVEEYYGILEYTNDAPVSSDLHGNGALTYEIVGENKIGASIDAATGKLTFADSTGKVGTITVKVTRAADDCYKACPAQYTLTLAYQSAPTTPYTLSGAMLNDSGWYTGTVSINAPAGYQISYSNALSTSDWATSVAFDTEGDNQAATVYLKDSNGSITDAIPVIGISLDKTYPENLAIEYNKVVWQTIFSKLFGFKNQSVLVEFTAADAVSGIAKMEWSKDGGQTYEVVTADLLGKYTATVNPQYRGKITLRVTDVAGNVMTTLDDAVPENDGQTLVVDDKKTEREVTYSAPHRILNAATMNEVTSYQEGDNAILYYKAPVEVTFKITEANFDLSLLLEGKAPVVSVNGNPVAVTWSNEDNDNTWEAKHTISGDGDYVVTMTYADLATNQMVDYTSCKIAIDSTPPVVDVKFDDGTTTQALDGIKYYKNTQTVAVQITDHNFRADEVVLTVTAEDVTGADVDVSAKKYAEYAKDRANWTSNGDVHTLKLDGMVFDTDAIYTFDIVYDDICDNFAADYAEDKFVIDHNAPTNLTISYSKPIIEKVIEALTFGFYEANVTVTLTADDITSGVDYFEWNYTKNSDSPVNAESYGGKIESGDITYAPDGKASATFAIPANARGHITATVTDKAGNANDKNDNTIINVVDKIAPEISVEYKADSTDTKVQFVDGNKLTVDSFEKAANAFYNGNVTANIVIKEANFFEGVQAADGVIHQVGIKLTRTDDDGKVTVTEYLPAGAAQKYPGADVEYITWNTNGDEHTFSISYADNADYVLEIEYADLSTNDADITANDGQAGTKTYRSKIVTVDKIAPVIKVDYSNNAIINTIENRKYFDKVQSATITVTEHNFRAADMKAVVTAVDFLKANVGVADFAAQLADEKNWTHEGNVHTAKIEYTVDANYTFDIDFLDLAQNASADYTMDLFTVDTTAPTNLKVSYSTNVFQEILESITFGYYNATMTVTITADDPTTGIHHFSYSYMKGKDVSGVNAELLNQAIAAAEIHHNGITGITTFTIPKLALGNDNQFNGTVEFVAYNRSEISTELKDETVIVVDNITPTSKITYNPPVQTANGISYYKGNINATIVVNEANFDAKDVVVRVTKDGANFPVNVSWKDDSVDTHTGTFTLTNDGDYIVSVQYKDKSGNQMTSYQSNELTLDATKPTIQVSNIKANSANKDEKYGFVITVNDTNLDVSSLTPVLKAVVQKEAGVYETVEIDLGEAETVVNGQTYTYTVEDLPDDGLYTLSCSVKDMSSNEMTQVVLNDGESYDQVQFSINRQGSVFGYGDQFSEELVGKYYIYSVDADVVIVEVNVDPIEDYKVTLNGKELAEGTDYTTTQTSKDGQWSKRTYTIQKALFEAEGEYSLIVSSTDKAATTAFSDVKNLSLAFVVDQTKPVLTITGLETGGRYQIDAQTVTLIPTDEGGRLNSLTVLVLDSNGNPLKDENGANISVRFDMSGEELLKHLEASDGKVIFTIPEGLNNQVKIICNDCAVDAENLTNEYNKLFERVTVSQNQLVIFYANTPAFVSTIAGILAVAVLIFFLIKRKKDKKNKTETKA